MAPVFLALAQESSQITLIWCHTGQHDEVATEMFRQFDIEPTIVLDRPMGDGLSNLVGGLIRSIDSILDWHKPDVVFVHGDTSSTLAAAMASFYRRIPVAHVEAGLRSGDLDNPYPEESNRRFVGMLACRHYAPTARAASNLIREGVNQDAIIVTGNTVVDAQNHIAEKFEIIPKIRRKVLVTMHRRENWPKLEKLCGVLGSLAADYPHLNFVLPVHPNPAVSSIVIGVLSGIPNVELCEPLGYLELQRCLSESALAITDSGGIQEEAPGFCVPCIVLRETTERPEAIESGLATLVGTDRDLILSEVDRWLNTEYLKTPNPFGDGLAAIRICDDVLGLLGIVRAESLTLKGAINA